MSTASAGTRFRHTSAAEGDRVRKARTLARWLWERAVTPQEVADVAEHYPALARRWAYQAQVHPPSSELTWQAVIANLRAMSEYAERHPDAIAAIQPYEHEHAQWIPAPAAPAPIPLNAPKGWAARAELGPVGHPEAVCHTCGAAAIVHTQDGWRCAAHPPTAGEWGAGLDYTPGPLHPYTHPDRPHRCYDERCPFYLAPLTKRSDPDWLSR